MIEWNGRSLQGKSYQEVADIIAESKQEANVELIVSRSMGSRRIAQACWKQSVAQRGTLTSQTFALSLMTHFQTNLSCCKNHILSIMNYY